MKRILICLVITIALFTACGENKKSGESTTNVNDTVLTQAPVAGNGGTAGASVNLLVSEYLQLKNALASDDGSTAASAAKKIVDAVEATDTTAFTTEEKRIYEDVREDMKEHADHISTNAGKLDHQREHFDMLSQGMYDMVKVFKPAQTLYQTHCPMYNDNKGASWLSETKEIKNPYYGKKMLKCGTVKEELVP